MYRDSNTYNPGRHPELKINLNSIEAVKEFSNIVINYDFNMDLASLTTRHIIDAKSIMGIFSLDLSKDIALIAYATPAEANKLFERISKFAVSA